MSKIKRGCADMAASFFIGVGVSNSVLQLFLLLAYPFVELGPLKTLIDMLPALVSVSFIGGVFAFLCFLLKLRGLCKTNLQGIILLLGPTVLVLAIGQCVLWPRARNDISIVAIASIGLFIGILATIIRSQVR